MRTFSFHPLAERELIEAARFYERRTEGLGRAFIDEVEALVRQITEMPESAPRLRGNIRRRPLRRFPYSLIYAVEADTVQILAMMHQKQRPDYWIGRA